VDRLKNRFPNTGGDVSAYWFRLAHDLLEPEKRAGRVSERAWPGDAVVLEMNLTLAEDEAAGETIQGPGLPKVDGKDLDPEDPRWFSTDCIEPPPLPGSDEAGDG
jgi:hypothetical protein